jgi:hypothetical protein
VANPEIPNFPVLLMEPLVSVPEPSRVGFLAQLERSAADRYREWAEESEELREGLLECANRESEIADRAEKLAHSLEDRIIIQAHAERQGSKAWLGFAAQAADETVRKEFLALADLEVESADHIDEALGVESTGDL